MNILRVFLTGLVAAMAGSAGAILVVIVGTAIGGIIEGQIGRPVVSWEMAPIVVGIFATPAGAVVALIGAVSGKWWQGLVIGLLIHGAFFGVLVFSSPSNPFEANCWAYVVSTIAGGVAGALGGAVRQLQSRRTGPATETG